MKYIADTPSNLIISTPAVFSDFSVSDGGQNYHGRHRKCCNPQRSHAPTESPGYMDKPCRLRAWQPTEKAATE